MLRFRCPNGHALQVQENLAGQEGACPKCGVAVRVPPKPAAAAADPSRPVAPAAKAAEATATPPPPATPESTAKPVAKPVARAVAKPITKAPAEANASSPAGVWYLRTAAGEQFGPADDALFSEWRSSGRVAADGHVWREGWPDWRTVAEASAALPGASPVAIPPEPQVASTAANRYARKQRRARRLRSLAAVGLLLLTLSLAGVLAWVLMGQGSVGVAPASDAVSNDEAASNAFPTPPPDEADETAGSEDLTDEDRSAEDDAE